MGNIKQKLLDWVSSVNKDPNLLNNGRNRMGCDENWYNPFYAITQTFEMSEIEKMSDDEVNRLYKLANNISQGLY